jgi:hypothetical protein
VSRSKAVLAEARDALLGTLRGVCDFVAEFVEAARHAVRRDIRRSSLAGSEAWHRSAPLTRIEEHRSTGA